MNKIGKNVLGIIIYTITAIISIITLITSYDSVARNLDGGHGFKSGHAIIFAIICIFMVCGCVFIAINSYKNNVNKFTHIIGIVLIALPLLFHIISIALAGNVDSDFQYLVLRTFQGFDNTYLYLIISSAIGYITLLCQKFMSKNRR